MIRLYATLEQYQAYSNDAFSTAAKVNVWLRKASRAVDRAAIGAIYPVDPQGYPLDANLIVSFQDACCEQVMFIRDSDDDTGVKARLSSVKVGSLNFTRAPGTEAQALPVLAPAALEILQLAGVIQVAPMTNW